MMNENTIKDLERFIEDNEKNVDIIIGVGEKGIAITSRLNPNVDSYVKSYLLPRNNLIGITRVLLPNPFFPVFEDRDGKKRASFFFSYNKFGIKTINLSKPINIIVVTYEIKTGLEIAVATYLIKLAACSAIRIIYSEHFTDSPKNQSRFISYQSFSDVFSKIKIRYYSVINHHRFNDDYILKNKLDKIAMRMISQWMPFTDDVISQSVYHPLSYELYTSSVNIDKSEIRSLLTDPDAGISGEIIDNEKRKAEYMYYMYMKTRPEVIGPFSSFLLSPFTNIYTNSSPFPVEKFGRFFLFPNIHIDFQENDIDDLMKENDFTMYVTLIVYHILDLLRKNSQNTLPSVPEFNDKTDFITHVYEYIESIRDKNRGKNPIEYYSVLEYLYELLIWFIEAKTEAEGTTFAKKMTTYVNTQDVFRFMYNDIITPVLSVINEKWGFGEFGEQIEYNMSDLNDINMEPFKLLHFAISLYTKSLNPLNYFYNRKIFLLLLSDIIKKDLPREGSEKYYEKVLGLLNNIFGGAIKVNVGFDPHVILEDERITDIIVDTLIEKYREEFENAAIFVYDNIADLVIGYKIYSKMGKNRPRIVVLSKSRGILNQIERIWREKKILLKSFFYSELEILPILKKFPSLRVIGIFPNTLNLKGNYDIKTLIHNDENGIEIEPLRNVGMIRTEYDMSFMPIY